MISYICLSLIMQSIVALSMQENKQCKIFNAHYKGDYLYAVSGWDKFNFFKREIRRWRPFENMSEKEKSVYRKAMWGVKDPNGDESVWQMMPETIASSSYLHPRFYIRNLKYGEYLYASSETWSPLGNAGYASLVTQDKRRKIFTWKSSSSNNNNDKLPSGSEYVWELREPFVVDGGVDIKEQNGNKMVTIWNVKYDEALYAPDDFFGIKKGSGGVMIGFLAFTYLGSPDETKFNWLFDCKN